MSFEQESDRKRITELEKTLGEVVDSELSATGGNDLSLINGTLGNRNSASGDAGGIRSNQPIIHNITDVDENDVSTGVFDKIDIISSMAIINHTSTPFDLRFIQGIVKDGTRIKITPKNGKTFIVKSGGNILTSSDITISDTEFFELVKYSEAETGVTGGAYKISKIGSGGGGGEFLGPWTADHDAGNFALNDLSSLQISDSVGGVHGLLQGLAATGVRLTLTAGEQFNIFDNITNISQMDSTIGLQLFGNDLTLGTGGNILAGGAGVGVTNVGHFDFVDNLATPAAAVSLYSDGTDLFANTGGTVVNFSNLAKQTPWLQNIDADGFSLNNLLSVDIEDSAGTTKLSISGPLGVGARFAFVSGDTVFFTENITDILSINATGLNLLNKDITMGTGEIIAGGAGKEIRNIGELVFVNNTLTPAGNGIIFFDGTDIKAKTGSTTVNLTNIGGSNFTDAVFRVTDELDITKKFAVDVGDGLTGFTTTLRFVATADRILSFPNATTVIPGLSTTQTFSGANTFSSDIIAGGAGFGMTSIGHLDFIDNIATPAAALSIYSDGTDILVNTGGGVVNLSNIGSQTPILQDVDYAGFNISDIENIQFKDNTTLPPSSIDFIAKELINLIYNTGGTDGHLFRIAGLQQFGIGVNINNSFNELSMNNNKITDTLDPTANQDVVTKFYHDTTPVNIGTQDGELWKAQTHPVFDTYLSNSKTGGILTSTFALPNSTLIFVPIYVGERIRITKIAIEITSPPGIGSNVRYGIYDSYPLENYPRDLIASGAEITGTTTGIEDSDTDISEDLEAGLYWLAITIDVSFTMRAFAKGDANSVGYERDTGSNSFQNVLGYTQVGSTLPNTTADNMIALEGPVPAIFALPTFNPN